MILVIDDDSAIRTSLSFLLKRAKYDVQAVASPKEAMAIVRAISPELILMDMNFSLTTSGDEGITLLKQVKIFRPFHPRHLTLCPVGIRQRHHQSHGGRLPNTDGTLGRKGIARTICFLRRLCYHGCARCSVYP